MKADKVVSNAVSDKKRLSRSMKVSFHSFMISLEKHTEIEKANRILLEKITNILRNKHHCPKDAMASFYANQSKPY